MARSYDVSDMRRRRRIFTSRSRLEPRALIRVLALVAAIAFVGLLVYGLTTKAADTSIDDALSRGEAQPAPGFELRRLDDGVVRKPPWRSAAADGRVSLAELRGTPVVLNFWASWCDPCRAEAPRLERAWRSVRRRGVLFVGLDQQDTREDARDFIRTFGLTFPQVRDPTNDTARAWGVSGIPETFFVDRGGRVVSHVIGVVSDAQLAAGIRAAELGRPGEPVDGGDQRPTR